MKFLLKFLLKFSVEVSGGVSVEFSFEVSVEVSVEVCVFEVLAILMLPALMLSRYGWKLDTLYKYLVKNPVQKNSAGPIKEKQRKKWILL